MRRIRLFAVASIAVGLLGLFAMACSPALSSEEGTDDTAEIVRLTLEWALIEKNMPDYNLLKDPTNIVLSTENIDPAIVPDLAGINLILMSPEEIQQKADDEGDFLRLRFQKLEVGGANATVALENTWVTAKDSTIGYLSGGGFEVEYTKQSGEWVRSENIMMWIS